MTEDKRPAASMARKYVIAAKDLPLSCPMPGMRLWDAHPRVFLPITKGGSVVCPYCGAEYTFNDAD